MMATMMQVMKERKSWDVHGYLFILCVCVAAYALVMEQSFLRREISNTSFGS
jgi:hypothetical protein